jgi:hypothetical protein
MSGLQAAARARGVNYAAAARALFTNPDKRFLFGARDNFCPSLLRVHFSQSRAK